MCPALLQYSCLPAGPSRHFSHLVGLGDHSGQQTASTNYTSENPMLLVQKFNGSPNIL